MRSALLWGVIVLVFAFSCLFCLCFMRCSNVSADGIRWTAKIKVKKKERQFSNCPLNGSGNSVVQRPDSGTRHRRSALSLPDFTRAHPRQQPAPPGQQRPLTPWPWVPALSRNGSVRCFLLKEPLRAPKTTKQDKSVFFFFFPFLSGRYRFSSLPSTNLRSDPRR